MVLPLYLAMTAEEMEDASPLPRYPARMACHFDPAGQGLRDIPETMPPGAMLILNDRFPCRDHDPRRIAAELAAAVSSFQCEGALLDFERPPDESAQMVADALFEALPCPVAAPPGFVRNSCRPVFLPPCPLHIPLAEYLQPWQGREVWLEAALQQQTITVTRSGTRYGPVTPADRQDGVSDELLMCRCVTETAEDAVRFVLFDTPETLKRKLAEAAGLGVSKAVGLYQELKSKILPLRGGSCQI